MLKKFSPDKIKTLCKTDSIAVIGNAPSAMDFRIGDVIDSYDCVIRINDYETDNHFADFVGTKTDVYLHHFYKKLFHKTEKKLKRQK